MNRFQPRHPKRLICCELCFTARGLICELCSRGFYCAGGRPQRAKRTQCRVGETTFLKGSAARHKSRGAVRCESQCKIGDNAKHLIHLILLHGRHLVHSTVVRNTTNATANVYVFPQIALAIGVLTSNRRGGRRTTLADWTWHPGCHCWLPLQLSS